MNLRPLPRLFSVSRHPDGQAYRVEAYDRELQDLEPIYDAMFENCSKGPVWEHIFSKFWHLCLLHLTPVCETKNSSCSKLTSAKNVTERKKQSSIYAFNF